MNGALVKWGHSQMEHWSNGANAALVKLSHSQMGHWSNGVIHKWGIGQMGHSHKEH